MTAAAVAGLAALTSRPLVAAIAAALAFVAGVWPMRSGRLAPPVHAQAPAEEAGEAAAARAHRPSLPEPAALASTEPDDVVSAMHQSAREAVSAVAAHLWLQDVPTATVRLVAAAGTLRPSGSPVSFEETWAEGPVSRGDSHLAPLLSLREDAEPTTLWRFSFPVASGTAAGVACLDVRSVERPDERALERVAMAYQPILSASLALHVARAETGRAANLVEAARDLSRRLEPDEVVDIALARAVALSSAASGSVMLPDEETGELRIAASVGLPAEIVSSTTVASGEGIAGWVFSNGKPLLVEDIAGESRRRGVRSAVCVPVSDEHGTLGVINVGSQDFPARFTDAHVSALQTLGRQVAISLRNARAMWSATDLYFSTLTALAVALETKDPYAMGGTRRVANLTLALGRHMALGERSLQALHVAALLHDVGMNMAGASLGATSRPLTTIERGLLKAHPVVAAQVLSDVPALTDVVPIVYHHHEWYDGHGYVGGLSGEDIPPESRILSVADAFVAMTSDRPYRRAMSSAAAIRELSEKAGTQFDPDAVGALKDVLTLDPGLAVRSAQD